MTISPDLETPADTYVFGALLGALSGAAHAGGTAGRPRVRPPSAPHPRLEDADAVVRMLVDPAPRDAWVVTAVRAGLARRCDPMTAFVAALPLGDRPRLEAAGVASVAAAVSAAVDGCGRPEVLGLALMAADMAADAAKDEPGPDLGARLHWACALATRADEDPDDVIDLLVGTTSSVQECVPAAFALLAAHDPSGDRSAPAPDVPALCRRAAALGGAADVVAVVVGAVLGAAYGEEGFPQALRDDVDGSWPGLRPHGAELATSRRT